MQTYLFFDAASLESCGDAWLPVWRMSVPHHRDERIRARLSAVRWEPLTEREQSVVPLSYLDTLSDICRVEEEVTRKRNFAVVMVFPFRYHGGRYEKMVSFHVTLESAVRTLSDESLQKSYAPHSVLASGEV